MAAVAAPASDTLGVGAFAGGGAQLAAELGAATADHLEQTDVAGIAALKAAKRNPVPLSKARAGSPA